MTTDVESRSVKERSGEGEVNVVSMASMSAGGGEESLGLVEGDGGELSIACENGELEL